MKKLRDYLFWKIMLVIIVLAVCAWLGLVNAGAQKDRTAMADRSAVKEEAAAAGYDEEFMYCSSRSDITIDGITYQRYARESDAFMGAGDREQLLMLPGISYKDASDGETEDLVIYGRTDGFIEPSDTGEDFSAYDADSFRVIEPYGIVPYEHNTAMDYIVPTICLGLIVIVCSAVLVIWFIYFLISKAVSGKTGAESGTTDGERRMI